MKKQDVEKMQNQIKTLIRANKALTGEVDALKQEIESLKPMGGDSAPSKANISRARQCFEAGDINGALSHLIGG